MLMREYDHGVSPKAHTHYRDNDLSIPQAIWVRSASRVQLVARGGHEPTPVR